MAKAMTLTPDALKAPQITPKAATPARSLAASPVAPTRAPKVDHVPLQVRIPKEDARAIKVAAAQADQTISEFMLACFHAHMKANAQN